MSKRYYQEELRARGKKRVYWVIDLDVAEAVDRGALALRMSSADLANTTLRETLIGSDNNQGETP